MHSRRRFALGLLFCLASVRSAVGLGSSGANQAQPPALTLDEAVGRLAGERSFAESDAALLKRYVTSTQALIQGQRLYAEGKAAFEALIVQLEVQLDEAAPPDRSTKLKAQLDAATEKRLAFSRHVEQAVTAPAGQKGVLVDSLAKGAGDIVAALLESAVAVWKEYRDSDRLRRQSIASRIDGQRWREFSAVAAAT